MTRGRVALWLGIGALLPMLLLVAALWGVSQTRWGSDLVLNLTVRALEGAAEGEVRIDRIEGDVLRGARLHGLEISEPDGTPFLRADSAEVDYSLRILASGVVALRRVALHRPRLALTRMPDDTLWNFQRVFPPSDEPADEPTAVLLGRVEIIDGEIVLQMPWEPEEELSDAEREEEIEAALSDTSRLVVEEVPGGYLRTTRFSALNMAARNAQLGGDDAGGTYLNIERFAGDLFIWREPLRVLALEGELAVADGAVQFRGVDIALPSSRVNAYGVIRFGDDDLAFDVTLESDQVAFTDLQWLYPLLPDEGGGLLTLHMETRPEGVLFLARDLDVRAPGTHLRGSFGLVVGEGTLFFAETDLEADPLSVETLEAMLPMELPITDLRIGGVRAETPR